MNVEGTKVTLFPAVKTSEKEIRNVSILLRVMELVPSFAGDLLKPIGRHVGKQSQAQYLCEVFIDGDKKNRPDGFIKIKKWSAIVEAKVGSNDIKADQLKRYVDLAKNKPIDAVITISNQMIANPSHHPTFSLTSIESRRLSLYHFSWQYIFTTLCLWSEREDELDPEQVEILSDFKNFLSSSESGMLSFKQMGKNWRCLMDDIRVLTGSESLSLNNPNVEASVDDWFSVERALCLQLCNKLKSPVKVKMPRNFLRGNFTSDRRAYGKKEFVESLILSSAFQIQNAADNLKLEADLEQKKIRAFMTIEANADRTTTKGRINWLKNMLSKVDDEFSEQVYVLMHWRQADTKSFTLKDFREINNFDVNFPRNPVSGFTLQMICSKTRSFESPTLFVRELENLVVNFYEQIGENLKKWTPKPPQIETNDKPATNNS